MKRNIWIAGVLIGGLALLSGCSKDSDEDVVKVGAILPLTGDTASYGQALKSGMDLAVQEVNSGGGVNGRQLRIIYEDSRGVPSQAVSSINKLIGSDRVPIVIGDMFSANTLAIAPIAEQKKTVLLSPTASAIELTNAGDFIFRIYPSDTYDGDFLARYVASQGMKKVGIIYLQVSSISSVVETFVSVAEGQGVTVSSKDGYQEGSKDFRALLLKAKQKQPDVIFIPGYLNEMAVLLKQAKELGISIPFISVSTFYDPKILELAGDAAEGVVFSSPAFDPQSQSPEIQSFVKAFKVAYEREPDILAGYGYDVVKIAAEAIGNAQKIKSSAIQDALYNIRDYPGVTGKTSFDQNGDVAKALRMMRVENGEFTAL